MSRRNSYAAVLERWIRLDKTLASPGGLKKREFVKRDKDGNLIPERLRVTTKTITRDLAAFRANGQHIVRQGHTTKEYRYRYGWNYMTKQRTYPLFLKNRR